MLRGVAPPWWGVSYVVRGCGTTMVVGVICYERCGTTMVVGVICCERCDTTMVVGVICCILHKLYLLSIYISCSSLNDYHVLI